MQTIGSILYYLFFLLTSLVLLPVAIIIGLLTFAIDKHLSILHQYTQYWCRLLLWVVPTWKVTVVGAEKINNKRVKVLVSNHQSEFDIVLVGKLFAHFKWVSKSEVFKAPIVGWVMRLNRYIPLKRGSRKGIFQMMRQSENTLCSGCSVYIFPEGTRSPNGQVQKMFSGAFSIAQKSKVGIQPVIISGTRNIMQKGDWRLCFKADIKIEVLDELPYEQIKDIPTNELTQSVQAIISRKVELK